MSFQVGPPKMGGLSSDNKTGPFGSRRACGSGTFEKHGQLA